MRVVGYVMHGDDGNGEEGCRMILQCNEEEGGRRRRKEGYARTREEGDEGSSVEVEAGSPDTAEKEDGGWDE